MNTNNLLTFALDAGELMLTSGAETYRVEDTIIHILKTSKGSDLQSFVTPTGIFASFITEDGTHHSHMRRIDRRDIHLSKIESVNDVSRRFCNKVMTLSDAQEELSLIKSDKGFNRHFMVLFTSMSAGLFALVLGGSFGDALITLMAGLVLALFQYFLLDRPISKFFLDLIGGFLTTVTALSLLRLTGYDGHQNIILISAIMPLVPGVAITNAIRDTLHGHLVSGNARILDAFIVAASIATGVGIALSVFNLIIGGVL